MFTEGFIKGLKTSGAIVGVAAVIAFGGVVLFNQNTLQHEIEGLKLTPAVVVQPSIEPTASPSATVVPTVYKKFTPIVVSPVVSKGVVK